MKDLIFRLPGWLVSAKQRERLVSRAALSGRASETKSYLWGLIEIGAEAIKYDDATLHKPEGKGRDNG